MSTPWVGADRICHLSTDLVGADELDPTLWTSCPWSAGDPGALVTQEAVLAAAFGFVSELVLVVVELLPESELPEVEPPESEPVVDELVSLDLSPDAPVEDEEALRESVR